MEQKVRKNIALKLKEPVLGKVEPPKTSIKLKEPVLGKVEPPKTSLKLKEPVLGKVESPKTSIKPQESGNMDTKVTKNTCTVFCVLFDKVEGPKVSESFKWNHSVRLIGRPVKDPLMHICETCSLPILIYGRMVQLLYAIL